MTMMTRLVLNVPIFLGGMAGIFLSNGFLFSGWALFVLAALMQHDIFNVRRSE